MDDLNLTIERRLAASPEAIFDAWTNAEQMAEWFSPMTTATIHKLDVREGGEFHIDMHGEKKDYVHTGQYLEVHRPRRLVFSWFSEGTEQKETRVTLELQSEGDGTLLRLKHERFPTEKSRDDHNGGWLAIIDKLEQRLVNRASA
jgi:uncharacterized protein YndB with AHSA1/START domain